jgi:hypothetical protein
MYEITYWLHKKMIKFNGQSQATQIALVLKLRAT